MVEEAIGPKVSSTKTVAKSVPLGIEELQGKSLSRIELVDGELQRVLGGGLVPGSVVLFGGEPGIGKSTLMLQVALQQNSLKVLYISGEESEEQISMRVSRLGLMNPDCSVLMETNLEQIIYHISELKPQLVIVDSIQTMSTGSLESAPGSVTQVRECANKIIEYAKQTSIPVFLIGHITKEGHLAGPKVLEHMVDTVLQFEGDRQHIFRLLRSTKNRFGSTNEMGIYEMTGVGLREVQDPSAVLLHREMGNLSGVAIASALEGVRPLMVEVQALTSTAVYGTPQRSTTGFDLRRLNMLLAVLEKRCGFRLAMKDVFLNIAGGLRIDDPALDMAVVAAILSSNEDIPLREGLSFAGEVGLSGEIRPVPRIDQRIAEVERLGFKEICVSSYNKGIGELSGRIKITQVSSVELLVAALFG
jgi:DNA repair protein RadA/Sms